MMGIICTPSWNRVTDTPRGRRSPPCLPDPHCVVRSLSLSGMPEGEKFGGPVVKGGQNLPLLVGLRLTDLPNIGGGGAAVAPPAPPGPPGSRINDC